MGDSYKDLVDSLNTHSVITARLMQLLWAREQIMESQRTPVRTIMKSVVLSSTESIQVLTDDATRKSVYVHASIGNIFMGPKQIVVNQARSFSLTGRTDILNDVINVASTNYIRYDSTDALWVARSDTTKSPVIQIITTHNAPLPPVQGANVKTFHEYANVQADIDKILSKL